MKKEKQHQSSFNLRIKGMVTCNSDSSRLPGEEEEEEGKY
jgi:hypothetical protein